MARLRGARVVVGTFVHHPVQVLVAFRAANGQRYVAMKGIRLTYLLDHQVVTSVIYSAALLCVRRPTESRLTAEDRCFSRGDAILAKLPPNRS